MNASAASFRALGILFLSIARTPAPSRGVMTRGVRVPILLIVGAMLASCHAERRIAAAAGELRRFEYTRVQMGVESRVVLYAESADAAREAAAAAFARIAELEGVMSDYRPDSELSRLTSFPAGSVIALSDDLYGVLGAAEEVSLASGGAFDVTIGPVTKLWREARRTGALPDEAILAEAWTRVGFTNLMIDRSTHQAMMAEPGMSLDAGGIGKGYAAQQAVELLRERGFGRCMVALAGDIVAGAPPIDESTGIEREGWRIEVRTGLDEKEPRTIMLSNAAVSTSGDSEQFFEIGGVRYAHIIDPRPARFPAFVPTLGGQSFTSARGVTVVSSRGEWADALDTALAIVGPEWLGVDGGEGRVASLLRRFGGGAAIIEWRDGMSGTTRSVTVDRDTMLRFAE